MIEYYGNEIAPGFGSAMKFQYDATGLIIGGKGFFNIFNGGNKLTSLLLIDKLNLGLGVLDFGFISNSIYDYWYDLSCNKCGN